MLLIVFISLPALSQQSDWDKTLGYYCGYSGSGTPAVKKVAMLLADENYKSLVKLLYSENPAENFLAIIVCKRLDHLKIISLSAKDLQRITGLFKSQEIVPTCGGCTERGEVKLSELLASKQQIFYTTEYYFGEH
jgi:hypothetical protein